MSARRLRASSLLLILVGIVFAACYKHGVPIPSAPSSSAAPSSTTAPHMLGSLPIPSYAGDFIVKPTATGAMTFGTSWSPAISQSVSTSSANGATITLTPQAPKVGGGGLPGDFSVNILPSDGAGTKYGGSLVKRNGTTLIRAGEYNEGAAYGSMWFVDADAPNNTNFAFLGNQTTTYLNVPSGGHLYLSVASNAVVDLTSASMSIGQVAGSAPYVFDFGATANFHFSNVATSAAISYDAPASDVTTHNLVLSAQGPWASATVHTDAADVAIAPPASVTGTQKYGGLVVDAPGTTTPLVRIGAYSGTTYGAIWFADAGTPTGTGFGFLGSSAQTYVNAPVGGILELTVGGSASYGLNVQGTSATTLSFNSGVTTAAITEAASAGAAAPMSVTAQAAGGTNDGGALSLGGGANAGSGTAYGSTKVTSAFNGGFYSTGFGVPVTLTAAQSCANFILAAPSAGSLSMTLTRRIADTSCIWMKNTGTNPVTVSYLTGGTVSVTNGTSALICSDGANLQKVMTGT